MIAGLWALLRFTPFGLHARATMTNADMARALGVEYDSHLHADIRPGLFPGRHCRSVVLARRADSAELWGGYTPIAFIVVVVAGSRNIIVGLTLSVLALALMKTLFTINFNILTGYVAMLVAALLVIRASPNGIGELLVKLRRLAAPHLGRELTRSAVSLSSTAARSRAARPLFWILFAGLRHRRWPSCPAMSAATPSSISIPSC